MFEIALLAHDGVGLRLEDAVQEFKHSLRAERLGERRGIAEVGEQQRHVGAGAAARPEPGSASTASSFSRGEK